MTSYEASYSSPSDRLAITCLALLMNWPVSTPLSLLRLTLGLILGIDISFNDASSWTGVIWGGLPGIGQQFHAPQFLESHATPILR